MDCFRQVGSQNNLKYLYNFYLRIEFLFLSFLPKNGQSYHYYSMLMQYHQERSILIKRNYYVHQIWSFIILSQHSIDEQSYRYYQMLMQYHQVRSILS
ncbi:unnamed protein product [Paramecium primaurelia]|uniref:Uncharacterized protein n=1 Tax=Paramecium primaurelia TaxID=5886 RepID=A0A8S1QQJ6_PARPR|nr:unnamed protein product [Paramecium primaurelia]